MQIVDILALLVPNIWTAITQLCATAVLFFALYKLAYKPVKKIMDARSEYEQNRLAEADALKKENEEMKKQMEAELAKADDKAREVIEEARQEGNRIKEVLEQEGKEKSEQMMAEAREDIEQQRSKMLSEMHEEIVNVAMTATEKLLNDKLNKKTDRKAVDEFIKEVTEK